MLALALVVVVGMLTATVGCSKQQAGEGDVPPPPPMEPMEEPPMPDEPTGEATTITQIGSTTVLPAAEKWQKAYNDEHPNVDIAISGGGSGTGIGALVEGTADIAMASRAIKDKEVKNAEDAGVNPVEHVVAYDGIAVVVNPANSVNELSIEELSDIFTGNITDWSEFGGEGEIVIVSRDSSSGTYEAFKEMVVQMNKTDESRDFAASALKQASNQAVHSTVSKTKTAIGYIGMGYLDDEVKAVAVAPMGGGDAAKPSNATVQDGSYAISRALYCYTDGEPTGQLKGYMEFIKSDEGQALAKEVGYVPIN
ncbi:MAG: phosphate ABC transporter substrate-binding protein [Armatimonadota bacterium]